MARRTKPAMALWIQSERHRLGLSVSQLVERLALIGVKVGSQTVQVWESYANRTPKPDTIDALERIFGSQAPERPDLEQGDVAAAIREQTDVIRDLAKVLVSELRELREARDLTQRVAELEAFAADSGLQRPSRRRSEGEPTLDDPSVRQSSAAVPS